MGKHTLGIIGYGFMGRWHACNIREKLPRLHVKGVYDIRQEALDKAYEDGLYTYSSLKELLDDDEVDLVTIAVPNNFHRELSIECLKAGKNVICEKPVTLNSSELIDIIDTAEKTGKLFSIHHNRRWDKDYCIVKNILEQNIIGEPYFIESRVQGSRRSMHGWRGHKENGGGMVLDWGVHLIDQILNLIPSPVISVDAHLFSVFSNEVDDNIKIVIRFENKVSAVLEMATNCFVNHPRWHISCKEGTAVINNWECDGKMVILNTDAVMKWGDDIVYTKAGPTRTMAPRPSYTLKELPLPEVTSDWSEYYINIIDVLDGKADLIVKPDQVLRVMKVIDLIFEVDRVGHGLPCYI
ncbi:MAG: Gfo/Idh/MocA family oxidoreductase [Hungateiclostridium thermocellum]|nr:Gfo/Idh/MocA family oxidoreductase [Acetivibrio thermocellus]